MTTQKIGHEPSAIKDPPHDVVQARLDQCGMSKEDNSNILARCGANGENVKYVGLCGAYPVGTTGQNLCTQLAATCAPASPDIGINQQNTMALTPNVSLPKPPGMSV